MTSTRRCWSWMRVMVLAACAACGDGNGGSGGAALHGQSVTVAARKTASVCIELSTGGEDVAATQNDLRWDPNCLNVQRCEVSPAIGKQLLTNQSGDRIRAIVISLEDVNPIPDGPLYCCNVRIDRSTGCCSLDITNVQGSDPEGHALSLGASAGEVCVE